MTGKHKNETLLRWILLLKSIIEGVGFYLFETQIHQENRIGVSLQLQAAEIIGAIGLLGLLALTIYSWWGGSEKVLAWLEKAMGLLQRFRWLSLPALISLFIVYPLLVMGHYGVYLAHPITRMVVFLMFVQGGALLLTVWQKNKTWIEMLPLSLFLFAAIYNAASYAPDVTNYPLSLGWSETSRFYYASTFFSERIYGMDVSWPHNHYSRYLMQAFPFLIKSLPLWAHRLWQVILRVAFPYLTGYFLSRRLGLGERLEKLSPALWVGLFVFQGPVFYQMLVIVIFIFWLFDSRKFWRSLILVSVLSIWAGFTRINWIPMPGLLATALFLMESPFGKNGLRSIARYLARPAVWVIAGGSIGLLASNWYGLNSGLPADVLYGYFDSVLLWYRLWPNLSYPLGVLPTILLISSPALLYFFSSMWKARKKWHLVRVLPLGLIVLTLFLGGLVVSIKIGGGTNLHNLDAFIVMTMLATVYLYYGKFVYEDGTSQPQRPGWLHQIIIVMIPVAFAILYRGQIPVLDFELAEWTVGRIQSKVDKFNQKEGEILFVTQRHLVTFDIVKNVELVPEYEKMILMEMAMAGNEAYLDMFSKDLESQRFSLIIHGRLPGYIKDVDEFALAEENNVYLERVAKIINCRYVLVDRIKGIGIDFLVPKDSDDCE